MKGRSTQLTGTGAHIAWRVGVLRSAAVRLFPALVLLALRVHSLAQMLTPGEPIVACTNPPNSNCPSTSPKAFTSGLFLDATQFNPPTGASTDMCGQINGAIKAADNTPGAPGYD